MTQWQNNGDPGATPGTAATTGNTAFPDAFTACLPVGAGRWDHNGGGKYRGFNPGSASDSWRAYIDLTAADAWSFRGYFTSQATPSNGVTLQRFINTSFAVNADIIFNATYQMIIRNAAGGTLSTYATPLVTGTEYLLESGIVKGTTTGNGTLRVRLSTAGGTVLHTYDPGAVVNAGTIQTLRVQIGQQTTTVNSDLLWRNLLLDNATSAFLGPYVAAVPPPQVTISNRAALSRSRRW